MKPVNKTKEQLSRELDRLSSRNSELEERNAELERAVNTPQETGIQPRIILDNLDDALILRDSKGNFGEVNQAAALLYGYTSPKEMIASTPDDGMFSFFDPHGELLPPDMRPYQRALRGKRVKNCECRVIRKDTGKEWYGLYTAIPVFDDNGRIKHVVISIRDITERKRSEIELQQLVGKAEEGHRTLEALLQNVPGGIVITGGPPDFPLKFISRHGIRMIQQSKDKVEGILSGEDQGKWGMYLPDGIKHPTPEQMPIYRATRKGEVIKEKEFVFKTPDGRNIPVLVNAAPILDDQGNIIAGVAAWWDISDRKQMEEDLKRSEEKYRQLFEDDLTGDFLAAADGSILMCNPSFVRIFGFSSREEALTKNLTDLFPTREEFQKFSNLLMERKQVDRYECNLKRSDGFIIHVVKNAVASFDENGKLIEIKAYITDDTERKRAEEERIESEERFRIMADSSPLMIWVTDAEANIQFVNRAYLEFFGAEREEAKGDYWAKFAYPDDKKSYINTFLMAWEGRKPFHAQARFRRSDGQWRWLDSFGIPRFSREGVFLGYVGSSPDITERIQAEEMLRENRNHLEELVKERTAELEVKNEQLKGEIAERRQTEENLRRSEELLRLAIDAAEMGFWEWDIKTDMVKPVYYSSVLSWRRKKMKMEESFAFLHQEDREYVREALQNAIRGERLFNADFRIIQSDGSIRWMHGEGDVVRDKSGKPVCMLGVNYDITKRKREEEEKKNLAAQLVQTQKIEALGRFAGGIAHDLNNLLYPIIMETESLAEEMEPGTPWQQAVRQVLAAAYRERDLVKQILSFSRRKELQLAPVKVIPLIKETITFMRSSLPSTIDIKEQINATHETILGDPSQVHQIIMNLFKNAADALPSQTGTIEISITNTRLEPMTSHPEIKAGNYLKLTVSDTGSGITPEVMSHIFEPFYTTKEVGRGSGMGLSVIHGIIKDYGGMITVDSKPGKGAQFTVYLPVIEEGPKVEERPPLEIPKAKGRILLVDDEYIVLSSASRALKRLGYEVTAVDDGSKALARFSEKPDAFDLVITDLTMPKMNGVDLAAQIKGIRSDIPVILSTGYNDVISEQEAKEKGISGLLFKPASPRDLGAAVGQVLGDH